MIKANLETRMIGRDIEYYTTLGSTNAEAASLLQKGAKEGTVVLTDSQTAGRGRHGRSWFSSAGKGLTVSCILRPNISGRSAGLVSLVAALAACHAMEKFQLTPKVKWPNDILLSGKKVGGVLVHTKFHGNVMSAAIVGIGINVNETEPEFPDSIRDSTTSIAVEKGSPVQRELALAWILNALENWYARLKSGDSASVVSSWEKRCSHMGKKVRFTRNGESVVGIFEGVAEGGEAIVLTVENSGRLTLSSEEISIVRETRAGP